MNKMLLYLAAAASNPFSLGTPEPHPQIQRLTASLADGLANDRLHWRSAAFAHLWLLISAPSGAASDDGGGHVGMARSLELHLRHAVAGDVVLIRVRAGSFASTAACLHHDVMPMS